MKLLKVGPSPHIHSPINTRVIMRDVIIALIPALVWSAYIFGPRALTLTVVSVLSCLGSELLFCRLTKRGSSLGDFSAAVTGMILAFNLPVTAPLWLPVLGGAFAIIVVKMLFGGIGKNFLNPALAARVFLFLSFPARMAGAFAAPAAARGLSPFALSPGLDGITSPTALLRIEEGIDKNGLINLLYGNIGGCIGEVSKVCLLAGFIYLLLRRVVSPRIPVAFLAATFLLSFFFPRGSDEAINFALASLLSGGLVFGALFMATDYSTSPMTSFGKIIFGAGCGALTFFFRAFGSYPEGVSFAILIMNCFVYYIDRLTRPVPFGGKVSSSLNTSGGDKRR